MWVAGTEYGTAAEVAARLSRPDSTVTEAMVRRWADRAGLPARKVGRTVYYPVNQAATIERDTRTSGRGRPRRVDVGILARA